MCVSLNLDWQWSSVSGLCACSVTFSGYVMRGCERRTGWKAEKITAFALFCFDKQANFCPGSSIFLTLQWWHKYRMNVPLLCSGRCVSPSVNKKITWICLLACSVSWRDCRRSLRSLSLFNIMHHKQYPMWTTELWKYTAQARGGGWHEMQPAVWVMSISTGLGWNNLCWGVIFLLMRGKKHGCFNLKKTNK